jgi:NAD+--asparagine ADP-ribosyltransferase
MGDNYANTYYQRNRERILEKIRIKNANRENAEKIRQYQEDYFKGRIDARKTYMAEYRKEHHDELAEKRRDTYRASVLEDLGRIVVPTAKKIDATGIEIRSQRRLETIGNTMHKRHLIERRLEINRLKAEQFKKILSGDTICPTNNESAEGEM